MKALEKEQAMLHWLSKRKSSESGSEKSGSSLGSSASRGSAMGRKRARTQDCDISMVLFQAQKELAAAWKALDSEIEAAVKNSPNSFSDGGLAYRISYHVSAVEESEAAIKMLQHILASNDNGKFTAA